MSRADTFVTPTLKAYSRSSPPLIRRQREPPPRRSVPFNEEPGFHHPAGVWMYGNVRLLWRELVSIEQVAGPPDHAPDELDEIEHITEKHVLEGKVLICGIHNEAHRRAALVPLRWGAPRIIVLSGGFRFHLGEDLEEEPFRAARLWRYQWDKDSDLAISRRAPSKLPTYARHNPTVDRMVSRIAANDWLGLRWIEKSVLRILA